MKKEDAPLEPKEVPSVASHSEASVDDKSAWKRTDKTPNEVTNEPDRSTSKDDQDSLDPVDAKSKLPPSKKNTAGPTTDSGDFGITNERTGHDQDEEEARPVGVRRRAFPNRGGNQPGAYRHGGDDHGEFRHFGDSVSTIGPSTRSLKSDSEDQQQGVTTAEVHRRQTTLLAATLVEDEAAVVAEPLPKRPTWKCVLAFAIVAVILIVSLTAALVRRPSEDGEDLNVAGTDDDTVSPTTSPSAPEVEDTWNPVGPAIEGNSTQQEAFGASVDISNDGQVLVVGAYLNDNENGVDAGIVRAYWLNESLTTATWVPLGQDLIGEGPSDNFGFSTAISGNGRVLAVGALTANNNAGYVALFELSRDEEWIPKGQILRGAPLDFFGGSLALSEDGNIVAIGAPQLDREGDDRPGYTAIYRYGYRGYQGWLPMGTGIIQSDNFCIPPRYGTPPPCDENGWAVSLSPDGNVLAIGAHRADSSQGSSAGRVSVWEWSNGFEWIQRGEDILGTTQNDRFGFSLSLSPDGNTVAVGAIQSGAPGDRSGYVRVLNFRNNTWVPLGSDLVGERGDDWFGNSVALSMSVQGLIVATGAHLHDGTGGSETGQVLTHRFDGTEWQVDEVALVGSLEGDRFGKSVAMSNGGRYLAVGADQDPNRNTGRGRVRVYHSAETEPTSMPTAIPSAIPSATSMPTDSVGQILPGPGSPVATPTIPLPSPTTRPPSAPRPTSTSFVPPVSPTMSPTSFLGSPPVVTDGTWNQAAQVATEGLAEEKVGYSVSLSTDGLTVATGAWGFGITDAGLVRVFERFPPGSLAGEEWAQLGPDIGGDGLPRIGLSLSLSADGRSLASGGALGSNAGLVRVMEFDQGSREWIQMGDLLDGDTAGDNFGASVSLSNNSMTVAVGADQFDSLLPQATGYVRIFRYEQNNWVPVGDTLLGETALGLFGTSVSLSGDGDKVAIGASFAGNGTLATRPGQVSLFHYNGTHWDTLGSAMYGDSHNDGFGASVSYSSDRDCIAVGAPQNFAPGGQPGYTRILCLAGDSWRQIGRDIQGVSPRDAFGSSVSLSADATIVAIGAIRSDGEGSNSGSVSIYGWNGRGWVQLGETVDGSLAGDNFGGSVSLAGNGLIVAGGASFNDGFGENSGEVKVYEYAL